tara:strand:+ start:363 stop:557 length:195 start_codon:yes stop_codon:yes gene_type:complete
MTKEIFTMWFQDGGGRTTIWSRRELKEYAKKYNFDADEVVRIGETEMLCDLDGDIIGGVFKEEE